ncbi:MAG: phosphatase PAP2 family protein [Nitrososphaeraceae archaeon]|nr:phosphatase PAP2 family protein [Nitrososphaeraceae archaeon]
MGVMLSPKLGYQNQDVIEFDEAMSSFIYNSHSNLIDHFMILLSTYGREIVWPAVIVLMSIFTGWKGRKIAIIMIISFLIIMPLNILFKYFFERTRPSIEVQELDILPKNDFGYPSGHASIVSGGAAILLILYRKEKELLFSLILAAEAALVCISRIYIGDHFLFDVVGGILLGVGISLLSISFSRYLDPVFVRVRKYFDKAP